LVFAALGLGILIVVAVKTLKTPTRFYAPEETAEELIPRLSCPKCRSRRLVANGLYTLSCETCGFTFSVGTVRKEQ